MKKKKVFVINRSVFGYKELKCEENEADFNEIQEKQKFLLEDL